jgi:hypothetical protein
VATTRSHHAEGLNAWAQSAHTLGQPMGVHKSDRRAWTRRDFVRAGLATRGAVALAAHGHGGILPLSAATNPVSNLDDLARSPG